MNSSRPHTVRRASGAFEPDELAVEEPLEIRLGFTNRGRRMLRSIAITMRTPGNDHELAVGFLYGEGIVESFDQVERVEHCGDEHEPNENVLKVELHAEVRPDLARLQRNFYTTSSCGVCGKSSLEALDVSGYDPVASELRVPAATITQLSDRARASQEVFQRTGGLHAAAAFDPTGTLLCLREDVGRHNAMDKVNGWALGRDDEPLTNAVLLLSGRASFELLQKALAARIPMVCAVGAPSTLAVDLADRFGITLIGFLRGMDFNVYTHPERLVLHE